MEMRDVKTMIHIVPNKGIRMPASSGLREGSEEKNCGLRRVTPSSIILKRKNASISKPKSVHAIPKYLNIWSCSLLLSIFRLLIFLLEFPLDIKADIIQDESEYE